jgi:hypothetical protein
MPWGDWQFWVVSGLALGALVVLVRGLVPRKKAARRTGLTVSARGVPKEGTR